MTFIAPFLRESGVSGVRAFPNTEMRRWTEPTWVCLTRNKVGCSRGGLSIGASSFPWLGKEKADETKNIMGIQSTLNDFAARALRVPKKTAPEEKKKSPGRNISITNPGGSSADCSAFVHQPAHVGILGIGEASKKRPWSSTITRPIRPVATSRLATTTACGWRGEHQSCIRLKETLANCPSAGV